MAGIAVQIEQKGTGIAGRRLIPGKQPQPIDGDEFDCAHCRAEPRLRKVRSLPVRHEQ
jgi:hypothetical protein